MHCKHDGSLWVTLSILGLRFHRSRAEDLTFLIHSVRSLKHSQIRTFGLIYQYSFTVLVSRKTTPVYCHSRPGSPELQGLGTPSLKQKNLSVERVAFHKDSGRHRHDCLPDPFRGVIEFLRFLRFV